MAHQQLVSVIIPCYNEEETIRMCIESFINQTYKNVEIIVVDDGSTDNSKRIVRDCINKYSDKIIKLIELQHGGVSRARNVGARYARGEYILFAEADGMYARNYVEQLIMPLKDDSVGGSIGGLRIAWSNRDNIIVRYWNSRWKAYLELVQEKRIPVIGAWGFRKKIFEKAGGYDEELNCGEDVDLANRIERMGYKIVFVSNTYMYHKDPDTLTKLIRREWWSSVNCKKFRKLWNLEPKGIKKMLFIGRNLLAFLLPLYLILACTHNIYWTILFFFGVFFAESIFAIWYDTWLRQSFIIALRENDYKLALTMPFICWLEVRTRAVGMFYAMIRGD